MTDEKIRIGMFGDSYISSSSTWIRYLRELDPRYRTDVHGKGGANLYYAIHQWREIAGDNASNYDWAFFTLTWPERLFSIWPYRNEQFCARSEFRTWKADCSIQTEQDNQEFLRSIDLYQKYIHDWHWRQFDYELEIRWILELPRQHPQTKFIIIPNTEESRTIARKHHDQGILLDMAFETISNLEPNSPGPMPVKDNDRLAHLNDKNHHAFADMVHGIITEHNAGANMILPVDLKRFDVMHDA
jgi:hypothetical protein